MRTLDPTLQGGLLDSPAPSTGRPNPLGGLLGNMNRLQQASLATSLLPVVPDVLGLAGDVQMYAQNPEERTPLNYGLSALGLLPFIPPIGATVFHGSPHLFDKFSMDKIGTGEGAQAYGHGLYFAENPEVARTYTQQAMTDPTFGGYLVPDAVFSDLRNLMEEAYKIGDRAASSGIDELMAGDLDLDAIKRKIVNIAEDDGVDPSESLARFQKALDKAQEYKGNFYTVDLPDEAIDKMLDWDKPLSEQPENVIAGLRRAGIDLPNKADIDAAEKVQNDAWDAYQSIRKQYGYKDKRTVDAEGVWQEARDSKEKLKQQWRMKGDDAYRSIGKTKEEATRILNTLGIPGIKYFDAGSRSAGEGTRNFVVFDDNLLNIKSRE